MFAIGSNQRPNFRKLLFEIGEGGVALFKQRALQSVQLIFDALGQTFAADAWDRHF